MCPYAITNHLRRRPLAHPQTMIRTHTQRVCIVFSTVSIVFFTLPVVSCFVDIPSPLLGGKLMNAYALTHAHTRTYAYTHTHLHTPTHPVMHPLTKTPTPPTHRGSALSSLPSR